MVGLWLFLWSLGSISAVAPPPERPRAGAALPGPATPALQMAATFGDESLRWRLLFERDSSGTIPAGAPMRANRERLANLQAKASTAGTVEGALAGTWRFRGPNNIGGRTRGIVVDPRDPKRILLGAATGGIYRTSDGGANWTPVNDFAPNLTTLSMALDPRNPDVVYVGTGETLRGAGILRSTNFGQTWSQLPSTADWWSTWRIAVSPADSSRIIAAIYDEHFGEGPGGLRLSIDGGATWNEVGPTYSLAETVLFRPDLPNEVMAGVEGWVFVNGHWFWRARALRSTDSGATWTEATGFNPDAGRIELVYAPGRPQVVYGNQNGLIWRSADAGRTFVHVGTLPPGTAQFSYNNVLWVSPTNASFLVVGVNGLLRSRDGGRTFHVISQGYTLTQDPHPDVHVLVGAPGFDGRTVKRLFVGTDGGFSVTDDIFTANAFRGWKTLNNGLVSTQFYHAAGNATSQILVGGTQDHGNLRVTASPTGAMMTGGDGGWVALDPVDGRMFYASYVYLGGFVRSVGGSPNWYEIGQSLPEQASPYVNFIAPFKIDPNARERMLAGGLALWRSNNVRRGTPPLWTSIKPALPGDPAAVYVSPIATIGLSKGRPGTIWVAHNEGQLFRTENGLAEQPAWITVDDNAGTNPLPVGRFPGTILIDQRDPRRVLVSFGGYADDCVWRTDDAGVSWRLAVGEGAAKLPAAGVSALAQHPLHPDWIYAGTSVGLFSSQDFGATWSATNEGPANVWVTHLEFLRGSSTTLLAATYGRGLWTIDIP